MRQGPLTSLKVVELGGVGPVPFCAMMLADMGADIVRIDRIGVSESGLPIERRYEFLMRGRRSIALDLKAKAGVNAALRLIKQADVVLEGFRPGVTERLGLGPEIARSFSRSWSMAG